MLTPSVNAQQKHPLQPTGKCQDSSSSRSLLIIPPTYIPDSIQPTRVFIGYFTFLPVTHENMGDRDSLVSREIPFMKLSDGSSSSLTAPPQPLPAPYYTMADGRAVARFAVEGNVVST